MINYNAGPKTKHSMTLWHPFPCKKHCLVMFSAPKCTSTMTFFPNSSPNLANFEVPVRRGSAIKVPVRYILLLFQDLAAMQSAHCSSQTSILWSGHSRTQTMSRPSICLWTFWRWNGCSCSRWLAADCCDRNCLLKDCSILIFSS